MRAVNKYEPFSVLMTVYGKDDPGFFRAALDSVVQQSVPPSQIVLVVDGPVPAELQTAIDETVGIYQSIDLLPLAKNLGSGLASQAGLALCRHELVARMDADDLSVPDRFERQLAYHQSHPQVDAWGGLIAEFATDPNDVLNVRTVAYEPREVARAARRRSPINNTTAMFKKSSVLKAGDYLDLRWFEDYYLWARMLAVGCSLANLPEVFVKVRIGSGMIGRRGGMAYFRNEKTLMQYMYKKGLISGGEYLRNLGERFFVHVAAPEKLRAFIYQRGMRKRIAGSAGTKDGE